MTDILGWRHCFGVLGPSTHTVVQPDMEAMRPTGVTNHYNRIFISNAQAVSNETFMAGVSVIDQNTLDAVASVMTAESGYEVVRDTCLEYPRWTAIAKVPPGPSATRSRPWTETTSTPPSRSALT